MPKLLRILRKERNTSASNAVVLINIFGEVEFMFTWFWQKPDTSDNRRVGVESIYRCLSASVNYNSSLPYYLGRKPSCQHGYDNTVSRAAPFLKGRGYSDEQIKFDPRRGVILSGINLQEEEEIEAAADALWAFWQTLKKEIAEGRKPLRNVKLHIEVNYISLDSKGDTPYFSLLEKGGKKHLLKMDFEFILSLHGKAIDKTKMRGYMERERIPISVSEQEAEEIRSLKDWNAMRKNWYKKYYYPEDLYIL